MHVQLSSHLPSLEAARPLGGLLQPSARVGSWREKGLCSWDQMHVGYEQRPGFALGVGLCVITQSSVAVDPRPS